MPFLSTGHDEDLNWNSLERLLNWHLRNPLFVRLRGNSGSLCCWPFVEIVAVAAWTFVAIVALNNISSCTIVPFAC